MTNRILHQVALAGGQVGGFSMYKFSHGQMFSFLLGVYLGVESLGHMVTHFPHSSVGKESACDAGDPGLIPGSGRSSGEGNGNPLQYSCLENPMDRGVWQATVHGIAKSQTQLSD